MYTTKKPNSITSPENVFGDLNRSEITEKLNRLSTIQNVALVEVLEDFSDK